MPSVALHTSATASDPSSASVGANPLPHLLHTPSGLAILEIQGTIHAPFPATQQTQPYSDAGIKQTQTQTPIGRLEFPLYDPVADGQGEGKWMKKVYLYVGKYQRLTGEVKKLGKPLGVVRKREDDEEALEIVEVVRYKVIFAGRPEPVGGEA